MKPVKLEHMIQEFVNNPKRCANCGELAADHFWLYQRSKEAWGAGYRLRCPHIIGSYYEKNKIN